MMADKKCPQCGRWNTSSALLCDCGYQFMLNQGTGLSEAIQFVEKVPVLIGESFSRRAGAYIIDSLVYLGTYYVLSFITGLFMGLVLVILGVDVNFNDQKIKDLGYFASFSAFMCYFVVFEWLFGATVGKMILGLRVVMMDGKPCGLIAAVIRCFLRFIDGLFFGLVAYGVMQQGAGGQRLGDKAAKTVVVRLKKTNIPNLRSWWWAFLAASCYIVFVILATSLLLILTLE